MAYYHPCKNCAADKEFCGRRISMRKAIAGLSITSVKFKCQDRVQKFRNGQRVNFKWTAYDNEQISQDEFDTSETQLSFSGTIIRETKSRLRFVIRVDEDQENNGYKPRDVLKSKNLVISIRHDDIMASGEADRSFCTSCLSYDKDEAASRCHGWCNGYWDTYHPNGCLLSKGELK